MTILAQKEQGGACPGSWAGLVPRPMRFLRLAVPLAVFAGCGEPMFENVGSQNSLVEDREAYAMEMEQGPAAIAYSQNPTAHPEYVSQVFTDMNQCIERKGWKQVRSPQEHERTSAQLHLN